MANLEGTRISHHSGRFNRWYQKDSKQAGGWTLYDTKREQLITGTAPVPGNPMTVNSKRLERGIQIVILRAVLLSAKTYKIQSSMVKIYIGNICSFLKTNKPPSQNILLIHLTNDYDLKTTIHQFEHNFWIPHKIEIIYIHVKCHKDNTS